MAAAKPNTIEATIRTSQTTVDIKGDLDENVIEIFGLISDPFRRQILLEQLLNKHASMLTAAQAIHLYSMAG